MEQKSLLKKKSEQIFHCVVNGCPSRMKKIYERLKQTKKKGNPKEFKTKTTKKNCISFQIEKQEQKKTKQKKS